MCEELNVALLYINKNYEQEIIFDSARMKSLLLDLAPHSSREIRVFLTVISDVQLVRNVVSVSNLSTPHLTNYLKEECGLSEEWARKMLFSLCVLLGRELPECKTVKEAVIGETPEISSKESQVEDNRSQRNHNIATSRVQMSGAKAEIIVKKTLLSTSGPQIIAVCPSGNVLYSGSKKIDFVKNWKDISSVSAGYLHVLGLTSQGTVVAAGSNSYGQCNTTLWKDIRKISAGIDFSVGLRMDGQVVATGNNENNQCDVAGWKSIIDIEAGAHHTVGIRKDKKVVAIGDNGYGQCNVSSWNNIVQVAAGYRHTVGLKEDGTVYAIGDNSEGQCNVNTWHDIIAVAASEEHTIGLKSNGTILITGSWTIEQSDLEDWKDIIDISAGGSCIAGLKADGTIRALNVALYILDGGEQISYKTIHWKLFENACISMAEAEEFYRLRRERQDNDVCEYCGGKFKGVFSKKCTKCGREKNY